MSQNKKPIHPVDRQTGQLLRHTRLKTGMTQNDLAERLGITFQQIQKYEKGQNRISTSRLVELALALGVPPASLLPQSMGYLSPDYSRSEHRAAKIARNIEDQAVLQQWLSIGEKLVGPS